MHIYIHFPFCRAKCAYCALHSRVAKREECEEYVSRIVRELRARFEKADSTTPLESLYFGGGTSALCDLTPIFNLLRDYAPPCDFTIELHPQDVTPARIDSFCAGGVNRFSLGVQSLHDETLRAMGRHHTAEDVKRVFSILRARVANVGMDLIAGYPGVTPNIWRETLEGVCALNPMHMSVYALIREKKTRLDLLFARGALKQPSDEAALAQVEMASTLFSTIGLTRYEVSNWARPGYECRHNLNVWQGGDYIGLGEGASGRENLMRTVGTREGYQREFVDAAHDKLERALFTWRLRAGVSFATITKLGWRQKVEDFEHQGLIETVGANKRLTQRGLEVCDAILAELM